MKRIFLLIVMTALLVTCFAGQDVASLKAQVQAASRATQRTDISIGAGTELARVPVDFYWKNSLYEVLYYASEMTNIPVSIQNVIFYNNFYSSNVQNKALRIWMGNTNIGALNSSWIPASQLTEVFNGTVSFPQGENTISIELDTPFNYVPNQNLVMMVQRPWDTNHYSMGDQFKAQTDTNIRARIVYSDSDQLDPFNPPHTTNYGGQFPKTTFVTLPIYNSVVSGVVSNQAGQALVGVQVNLNSGTYFTSTNQYGHYQFNDLPAGEYEIQFELNGYFPHSQVFSLGIDDAAVIDLTMQAMPRVSVSGTVVEADSGLPISAASVSFTGYTSHNGSTAADGQFTVSSLTAGMAYLCTISAEGFATYQRPITLGTTDYLMGIIPLAELSIPPTNVNAQLDDSEELVLLNWIPPAENQRSFSGYLVYRFAAEQYQNPENWILLTPEMIEQNAFIDSLWTCIPNGHYYWAVRSVFGEDSLSEAAYSNALFNDVITGILAGTVRQITTIPIVGATIRAGHSVGHTNHAGQYSIIVKVGSYDVNVSARGFFSQTENDVEIHEGSPTSLHFILEPDPSPSDDHFLVPNLQNLRVFPNPFRNNTSISYELLKAERVKIEIYNLKGQLVSVLKNELQKPGIHTSNFDGKTAEGHALPSGIYLIKTHIGSQYRLSKVLKW